MIWLDINVALVDHNRLQRRIYSLNLRKERSSTDNARWEGRRQTGNDYACAHQVCCDCVPGVTNSLRPWFLKFLR